jgi:hypothetical protein
MKRSLAKSFAVLTLGIAGAFVIPSNGQADYLPWGGGCCGSTYTAGYLPTYTGYFPSYYGAGYYGGLYGVGYYAGYYPVAYGSNYYGSSCCGGLGSPCGSSGCGSLGCGSFGCGSCGTGCCGAPLAYSGGCGCGPSCCGSGLACANGCGCANDMASGSGCSGVGSSGPHAKKAQPTQDGDFVPRPSPTYDDAPPPRASKKAPLSPPEPGSGASGPAGTTGTEEPPAGEPAASRRFKRSQNTDQGPADAPKGPTGGAQGFQAPASPKTPGGAPAPESPPFETKKPVTPPPQKQSGRKAPINNLPDADSTEDVQNRSTASYDGNGSDPTRNPALGLQERATWSYSTTRHMTVGRIASTTGPTPQRLRTQTGEWAAAPVEAKVVRN